MDPISRLLSVSVAGLLFAACSATASNSTPSAASATTDTTALRRTFTARFDTLMQQVVRKSADGVANAFTADGVWIDGGPLRAVVGREAIRTAFIELLGSLDTLTVEELALDHIVPVNEREVVTFAHLRASFSVKGQSAPVRLVEYSVDHWVREADGVWRVRYESNGQAPVAPK